MQDEKDTKRSKKAKEKGDDAPKTETRSSPRQRCRWTAGCCCSPPRPGAAGTWPGAPPALLQRRGGPRGRGRRGCCWDCEWKSVSVCRFLVILSLFLFSFMKLGVQDGGMGMGGFGLHRLVVAVRHFYQDIFF